MSKVKIICTLGPASGSAGVLTRMMRSGMDVVRLNFSHGSQAEHLQHIKMIRLINKKNRRHIRILGDLEGYRIRIGKLKGGIPLELKKGQDIHLTGQDIEGAADRIPFDYTGPLESIRKGQSIFIDDGNIALEAEGFDKKGVKAKVIVGGFLKEHKGVNMPGLKLAFKGLTAKDKVNITFCLDQKIDFIAQSFVRDQEDILALKKFIGMHAHQPALIAKIENRDGVRNIDRIMAVSQGIMIARGDMGVSLPVYEVPMIQKSIIKKCNQAGIFVITATQMLESMIHNRLPTRAEVSDVANAILDGTDFVMLSAESAVGHDPAGCVAMMENVIRFTEQSSRQDNG
ncbi:MAG: pyruvate kinase [Candidatus Omnitrophota bacterium]